jgi:hypothetical protein
MAPKDEEEKGSGPKAAQATPTTSETAPADARASDRRVKYGVRDAAQVATEEFSGPIIGFVRDTLSGTLRATGAVANDAVGVVRDVLTGAVHATEEVGTETLGVVGTLGNGVISTARDILVGGVGGIREVVGSVPLRRAPDEAARAREPAALR